jgi:hypothetical protein
VEDFIKDNMMMKITQILLVVALITLLLGGAVGAVPAMAQEAVQVSINSPAEVESGTDFTVKVDITGVVDFDASQYDVSFDNSVLRLDDVTAGLINTTEIPVSLWVEISPGTYRILQNVPGIPGISGSGYLAIMHFHVTGSAGDSSDINLSSGFLNDNLADEIPATWTGGSVTMYEEVVITTTSLSDGVVGSGYSVVLAATGGTGSHTWSVSSGSLPGGLSLSSTGAISGTPTTAGTFSFIVRVIDGALSDSKVLAIKINERPGDANQDGGINTADITMVERIIVELEVSTFGADANQDGGINTADITKIERIIAGLD